MAQTSDKISAIAARYLNVSAATLIALTESPTSAMKLRDDIRAMAASLLRQDETKGLRKILRKIVG